MRKQETRCVFRILKYKRTQGRLHLTIVFVMGQTLYEFGELAALDDLMTCVIIHINHQTFVVIGEELFFVIRQIILSGRVIRQDM